METEKQQSAVEWLVQQLRNGKEFNDELIQQAKEMEKEQIIEFAKDCIHKDDCFFIVEQYYKETFKSE